MNALIAVNQPFQVRQVQNQSGVVYRSFFLLSAGVVLRFERDVLHCNKKSASLLGRMDSALC